MEADLLTTEEAAEFLGVGKRALETWRQRGGKFHIPFIRLGRAVRYRRRDLEDFILRQIK